MTDYDLNETDKYFLEKRQDEFCWWNPNSNIGGNHEKWIRVESRDWEWGRFTLSMSNSLLEVFLHFKDNK